MSLMHLALNENLTTEQFANILEQRAKNTGELLYLFKENYHQCESEEIKSKYLSECLPILMMSMF